MFIKKEKPSKDFIKYSELPNDLQRCYNLEIIKNIIFIIILISFAIHVSKLIGIILLIMALLIVISCIRYYIIVSGKLLQINGTCISIEDYIPFPILSKLEKSKVCIIQNESYCYKVTVSKNKAKKIYAGMNLHIYVMPGNVYQNMEGFIVINNPMYLISQINQMN